MNYRSVRRQLFSLAMCVGLAACNQQADEEKAVVEAGEVLPGTISDAMIDLDTSTASPPLAPVKQPGKSKGPTDESSGAIHDESDEKSGNESSAEAAAKVPAAASAGRE